MSRMTELFDSKELSRREDPETSKQAARDMEVSGRLGAECARVHELLKSHEGFTANELDEIAGTPRGDSRKRLSDLRKMGIAKNGPDKRDTATGKDGQTWWLSTTKVPEDDWEKFWEAYPRKTAKRDALKAYRRLAPNAELQEKILKAIEAQKKSIWAGKALEYVPHPATWLNGERWNDEVKLTTKVAAAPLRTTEDVVKEMKSRKEKYSVTEEELKHSQELLRQWKERRLKESAEPSATLPGSDGQVESPI